MTADGLKTAQGVFRADLYHSALGREGRPSTPSKAIGAFTGPPFDPRDIEAYFAALRRGPLES